MRTAGAGLISFLKSRQPAWQADLYTFSLANGTTVRLCSADRDISYGGNLFECGKSTTVGITRGRWAIKNTIEVPELEVTILSSGTDYTSGSNIKLAMHNGLLDGCWMDLQRVFMQVIGGVWGDTSLGAIDVFAGRVGEVQISPIGAKIKVRGANILMQQYMPRNRFLSSCIHTLYDAGCTLNRASFTFAGTVASSSAISVGWASDPTSGNYAQLALGKIAMTSGAANGEVRSIASATSGGVTTMYPWYVNPSPGDTFNVVYGCDKKIAGGCAFFSNTQHFRGFDLVPPEETAVVA